MAHKFSCAKNRCESVSLSNGLCRKLEPNFDFVSVRIGEEHVRLPRRKFPTVEDPSSRALDGVRRLVDVARVCQAKSEVLDATRLTYVLGSFLEHENVACPRRLCL